MPISIIHIGLPLDHPLIPVGEGAKIRQRLDEIQQRMRDAGYRYEIVHASPEGGLDAFGEQLKTLSCDGVLIGGAVTGDPSLRDFMEQIIAVTHQVVPEAKIMFFDHTVDVRETVAQAFGLLS